MNIWLVVLVLGKTTATLGPMPDTETCSRMAAGVGVAITKELKTTGRQLPAVGGVQLRYSDITTGCVLSPSRPEIEKQDGAFPT